MQGVKFQPHYIHIFCPDGKNDNDRHDYLFLVGWLVGGWQSLYSTALWMTSNVCFYPPFLMIGSLQGEISV